VLDGASKATLENEFGTSNEDECIIKILENGEVQKTQVRNYLILQNLVFTKLTQQYIEQ
jgi:ribosome maturation protein Sdo1